MKPRYLGTGIVFLLVSASFIHAGEADLARVFDMPRYEAEQIIKDWLIKGGYEASSDTAAGKVVIRAVKQGSLWEITLRHNSPLATEVTSGGTTMGRADALWRFLADYQEGSISARGFSPREMPMPVRNRKGTVVCIRALVRDRPIQLSGFVVDSSGLILCTAHMLKNPTEITVTPLSGKSLSGNIVKIDFKRDLALIDCTQTFGNPVALNNGKPAPERGQKVFSIGCPLNHAGTTMTGVVSGPPRLVEGQPLLQVRMEVEPGSSGSPVFDEQGDLAGVVQGRMKGDHLSGLLIPLDTVISFIKEK